MKKLFRIVSLLIMTAILVSVSGCMSARGVSSKKKNEEYRKGIADDLQGPLSAKNEWFQINRSWYAHECYY